MNWLYFSVLFVALWLIRALYFFLKLRQTKKLKAKYYQYLEQPAFDFFQHKPQILELFRIAGLKDFGVNHFELITQSSGISQTVFGFANLGTRRKDIEVKIKERFEEAIGTFKLKMLQSISPLFWLEIIIKFPEKVFSFIKVSLPESAMKAIQLLYWVVGFLAAAKTFNIYDVSALFN